VFTTFTVKFPCMLDNFKKKDNGCEVFTTFTLKFPNKFTLTK